MTVDTHRYQSLTPSVTGYWLSLGLLVVFAIVGFYCARHLEHVGHIASGMNNHYVWGLPHVFAISLILAASGALNAASLSSVFAIDHYKPYARLSVVLAISLLVGGLMVLVLDLGRPDRLIVAMTHYNFRSIFTWNIFLYSGFVAIGLVYLWFMMEKRFNRHVRVAGVVAFVWRIVLTTGTGSIFGFLVGRNALDTAILAPMFLALSLVMGTAVFFFLLVLSARWQKRPSSRRVTHSLASLQLWFVLALVYFSIVHHLTNLYVAEHTEVEQAVLGGSLAPLFWVGHIVLGVVVPVILLLRARATRTAAGKKDSQSALNTRTLMWVHASALLGGIALVYVIVIGSQSTPEPLFPGKRVLSSSFGDAGYAERVCRRANWLLHRGAQVAKPP